MATHDFTTTPVLNDLLRRSKVHDFSDLTAPPTLQSPLLEVGSMARPKRNIETILETWLTPKQVAAMKGISESAVRYLCQEGILTAENVAGRWYIEPESAAEYQVSGRAQKYKDSNE